MHLQEQGFTYWAHFKFAFKAGILLILAGIASVIHAIVPDLLPGFSERTARTLVEQSRKRYEDKS